MAVRVRAVREEEYAVVADLTVAAYSALPGAHLDSGYEKELRDVARRVALAVTLVAADEHDGDRHQPARLLGAVTYVPDAASPYAEQLGPRDAGMRMLAVLPAAQRRGVGETLARACIMRAREDRRSALWLHTTPWMDGAQRLYRRLGFERDPSRDWQPYPEVPLHAYVFRLGVG